MVSATSAEENAFVFDLVKNDPGFWSKQPGGGVITVGPWLGGWQDHSDALYTEPAGAWKWADGSPWAWANWHPWPQPDDQEGQDFLIFWGMDDSGELVPAPTWDDYWGTGVCSGAHVVSGYIVEWSGAPPAVPEPGSCALLALAVGGTGAALRRRRKR